MSAEDQQNADHKSPPETVVAPNAKPPISCTTSYPTTESEKAKNFKEFLKKPKSQVEIIGLLILLAYTIFAGQQSCTTSNTLAEIKKQTPKVSESADAATKANILARQTLESVQRAFVVFENMTSDPFVQADTHGNLYDIFLFGARVSNSGTTPAKGIAQRFVGKMLANEPVEADFTEGGVGRATFIGPKDTVTFGTFTERGTHIAHGPLERLTSAQRPNLCRPTCLYLWGWISYRDILPNTKVHITEFCNVISGIEAFPANPPLLPRMRLNFRFSNCVQHNCTDEDCEDYKQIAATHPNQPVPGKK